MLTQERLKEVLNYDPESGIFTRLVSTSNCVKVGDVAGTINSRGYLQIMIADKRYLAHRLAFLYMTGAFPKDCTDHINGIRGDNRWINLRQCTKTENGQNRTSNKNSSSKYPGVCCDKKAKKWRAQIKINGKVKYLGLFQAESEAYAVYCKAKAELHTFNPQPRGLIPC